MMKSCVLIAIFAISCRCDEQSWVQNKKPALIIDRLTGSIIDLPPSISKKSQCDSWANACPAQSSKDEAFIAKNALNENALFVAQICTEGETLETAKFGRDICSKNFQISVVFNKTNLTFDFGYEVYVVEENENLFPNLNQRRNYISVEKVLNPTDTDTDSDSGLTKVTNEILHFVFGHKDTFPYDDEFDMSFMWISLFEVEFEFQRLTPKVIFYQVRNNDRWPVRSSSPCQEDKLVDEIYQKFNKKSLQNFDLKTMYSDFFQQKTFVLFVLPEETTFAGCRDKGVCLNQWSLIPIDQFSFGALEETQCSPMATIPIWTSTLKLPLAKVDKFIYALFQVMGSQLHIVAGISDQLRLHFKRPEDYYRTGKTESDIYLDTGGKKVPVPGIIYKVVKYKPDNCTEGNLCWYSATIIIHNNPFFDSEESICPDVTAEWGWTEVNLYADDLPDSTKKRYQSKYIYVCKSEPELLTLLMGSSAEKQPQKMKDFNLTELLPKGTKNSIRHESIESEVFKKLLVLTEIQSELLETESERVLAKREFDLMSREKYFSLVEEIDEDNASKDDSEGNIVDPIHRSGDINVIGINKGIEENDGEKIQLAKKDEIIPTN